MCLVDDLIVRSFCYLRLNLFGLLLVDTVGVRLQTLDELNGVPSPQSIFWESATSRHVRVRSHYDSKYPIDYPLSICAPSITTVLNPICTSSSIIAFVMLQECSMFTLFPIVVDIGNASSGTQNAD